MIVIPKSSLKTCFTRLICPNAEMQKRTWAIGHYRKYLETENNAYAKFWSD